MREIILDTETTGISPTNGHRIVDIGCLEMINGEVTGKSFQQYINPERDMPKEAQAVHGLSQEFLMQFPKFQEIYHLFLAFISDSPLVIHNARFDVNFINFELKRLGQKDMVNPVIDTLSLAKKKFPGMPASLDALCKRFGISLKERQDHGALVDARLLSKIYPLLNQTKTLQWEEKMTMVKGRVRPTHAARTFALLDEEEVAYRQLCQELGRN